MDNIKRFFLNYKIKKASKQSFRVQRKMLRYKNVKNIGLLFYLNKEAEISQLNKLVDSLRKDKKSVKAITFFPKPQENLYNFAVSSFSLKEVSFFGKINSEEVANFINTPFDLLFYINADQPIAGLDFILASSKAKCRIGKHDENRLAFFDLMIHVSKEDTSLNILINEMLRCIKEIGEQQYQFN